MRARVERWLEREGLADDSTLDALADEAPLLAHACATSIYGQSTIERPYAPIRRPGRAKARERSHVPSALRAHAEGLDLHAGLCIASQHPTGREPLEKLLRYCARPPIADDRLKQRPDGRIVLQLKSTWHDGTTHLELDALDFVARCAALVPRPHSWTAPPSAASSPTSACRPSSSRSHLRGDRQPTDPAYPYL